MTAEGRGYALGVDIGTTFTAAAVARGGAKVEMATLGNRAPSIPSVVFLGADDAILTGDPANRRSLTEPERVAREFKRRIGDPTPILVGGVPFSAERLLAKLLRWTVDAVTEREGAAPDAVAVCHPANWGPYKLDLLRQGISLGGLDHAELLPEPVAAAAWYASTERVEPGELVVVYDLGGGTFDVCVLRRTESSFEIVGEPDGIERLGGIDFDAAIFGHVNRAVGPALAAVDPEDPGALAGMARLRQECVEAKESLSSDTEASIPVLLPSVQTEVRLTRTELEAMIRPAVTETIDVVRRALERAAVSPSEVRSVLLVGGSSRIPLVGHLVSEAFGRPVAVDAHPKHAIALGAALVAADAVRAPAPPEVAVVAEAPAPTAAPAPPPAPTPGAVVAAAGSQKRNLVPVAVGAAVLVVLLAVGALALGGGGGKGEESEAGTAAPATSSTTAEASTTSAPTTAAPTTAAPSAAPTTSAPLCTGPSGRCTRITGIRTQGGDYAVDYQAVGFTPDIDGGSRAHHVHFFFDTVAQENAGTNGPNPGQWELYDGPNPFTGYSIREKPSGARRMCILVADNRHGVEVGTGNCVDLPA